MARRPCVSPRIRVGGGNGWLEATNIGVFSCVGNDAEWLRAGPDAIHIPLHDVEKLWH